MAAQVYPKYPKDLDLSRELPHPQFESFCRAIARAESATDAFRTYIEPGCELARARRCGPKLWKKWWIQGRVRYLEDRLQEVASVRAPLTKDDVLDTICSKFKKVAEMEANTAKEVADQVRALCPLGEMICKLTGAYAQKPGKHQVSIKVRNDDVQEDAQ